MHRGGADVAMFPRNSTSNRLHTKIVLVTLASHGRLLSLRFGP
jgi:hypothetical protein